MSRPDVGRLFFGITRKVGALTVASSDYTHQEFLGLRAVGRVYLIVLRPRSTALGAPRRHLERVGRATQKTDVFLIHINIQEAPRLAGFIA